MRLLATLSIALMSACFGAAALAQSATYTTVGGVRVQVTSQPKSSTPAPAPTQSPTPPANTPPPASSVPAAPTAVPKTQLGINISSPSYWSGERSFMNLIAGSGWTYQPVLYGPYAAIPAGVLDAQKQIVALPKGAQLIRIIQPPNDVLAGKATPVICRWSGKGTVSLTSWMSKDAVYAANSVKFTFNPNGLVGVNINITSSDPADPLRNLDCREAAADPSTLFSLAFVANIARYSVARFMDWQNTNANNPVTWATRTRAGDGINMGPDGVAVEHMVALANQAKVDPWFTVPWNADDDYVRRFATYVRDNLAGDRKAYVEVSNEVWNWMFKVTSQARDEGKARGLSQSDGYAVLDRYAEKSGQALKIWTDVFASQSARLVRVIATQKSNALAIRRILEFKDTAAYADAVATAPYFGAKIDPADTRFDKAFADMPADIDSQIAALIETKKTATALGKRFIAYEAGQHIVLADIPRAQALQRDPRFADAYKRYLTKWQAQVGDLLTLFSDVRVIDKYGAWGMQEYAGQPAAQAPKLAGVEAWMAANPKGAAPTPVPPAPVCP